MQIALINSSTVLSDAEVATLVIPLAIQGQRDLAPAWGMADLPVVTFVGSGQKPAPGSWWLTVLDNSDQAGALGYHDVTDEGLPIGKVFAGTDLQYSSSWTVTASHEFCEMLVDPSCTSMQQTTQGNAALEVCDACEDDSFGYMIDGVLMSDFVTPPFFEDLAPYGSWTRFDYGGHIIKPMQILTGGYLSVQNSAGNWVQVDGDKMPLRHQRAPVGSRRERRAWRSHGHPWTRSLPR